MKKIDLHIHTVKNEYLDVSFNYSSESMREYVKSNGFDVIAITNHNLFDINNFKIIKNDLNDLDVKVFPGIEISLESGHILVIGDDSDEYYNELISISNYIHPNELSDKYKMTVNEFNSLVGKKNFLIIPHYKKGPEISDDIIARISDEIMIGEVGSPKNFYGMKKKNGLVPVYFSDIRIGLYDTSYYSSGSRYTYLNCDNADFSTIKRSLESMNCVDLNKDGLEEEFEILKGNARASSGINVLIGNRSSGKTYTLEHIFKENEADSLYIKQFEITQDCKDDEFARKIKNSDQQIVANYFKELLGLFDYIDTFDVDNMLASIDNYLSTLKLYAKQSITDTYSKLNLFNYIKLENKDDNEIKKLVDSADNLLSASDDYESIISKHLEKNNLIDLYNELVATRKNLYLYNKKVTLTNDILKAISDLLSGKSSVIRIMDTDFNDVFRIKYAKRKFNNLIASINERIIDESSIMHKFNKEVKIFKHNNKTKIKSYLGVSQTSRIDYLIDKNPFDAYQEAKNDDNIANKTGEVRYKMFFDYDVRVINETGNSISGGQKAEYTLLNKLSNYQKYDFVLIDEMEASFDNPFLNIEVIDLIKTMSKTCTIFVSTHNNNLGVSLKPDYYIYHRIELDGDAYRYVRYFGKSNEEKLYDINSKYVNLSKVLMDTMEASKIAYDERGKKYENNGN